MANGMAFQKISSSLYTLYYSIMHFNTLLYWGGGGGFSKREHHMYLWYLLPRIGVLSRGVSPLESVL